MPFWSWRHYQGLLSSVPCGALPVRCSPALLGRLPAKAPQGENPHPNLARPRLFLSVRVADSTGLPALPVVRLKFCLTAKIVKWIPTRLVQFLYGVFLLSYSLFGPTRSVVSSCLPCALPRGHTKCLSCNFDVECVHCLVCLKPNQRHSQIKRYKAHEASLRHVIGRRFKLELHICQCS